MNGWTTTKVWEVNGKMVVADNIETAISVYRLFAPKAEIESVKAVSSGYAKDFAAIKEEICFGH